MECSQYYLLLLCVFGATSLNVAIRLQYPFFKDQKRAANVILFSSFLVLLWISFFNTRMVISAYADPLLGLCLFNLFMYLYLERQKKTPSKRF